MTNSQQSSQQSSLDVPEGMNAPLSNAKLGENSVTDVARSEPNSDNISVSLKMAEEEHQYLREYIRNADQKAIFFFTICSGLLAFMNLQHASSRWLKLPTSWSLLDFAAFLSMSGLAVGAIMFLWVVVPRLKGSMKGLIFFNSVAEYESGDAYMADILRATGEDLMRAKLKHCYELAKICKAKYSKLVCGLYIGAIAYVSTLTFLLFTQGI